MLPVLLALRVTEVLTEAEALPFVDAKSVARIVKHDEPAIVFFGSNRSEFAYASLAIHRYRKTIRFVFSDAACASGFNVTVTPSAAAFYAGDHLNVTFVRGNQLKFTQFCQSVILKILMRKQISQAEELRRIFTSTSSYLFGVDTTDPPADYRNDVIFLTVRSQLLRFFNITPRSRYYVYRGIDRQFSPVTRNYRLYLKSTLTDLALADFSEKPFLGGFVIDMMDDQTAEAQFQVLHRLHKRFGKTFMFSPIFGQVGQMVRGIAKLTELHQPLFVVWKGKVNETRWALQGPAVWENGALDAWIDRIAKGEQPVEPVVQADPEPGQLTYATFNAAVNRTAIVMVFVCEGGLPEQFADSTDLDEAKAKFPDAAFFAFHIGRNDLPDLLDVRAKPPFVALFKNGEMVGTWRYPGKIELPDLLNIVQADELG
jgi:hypothetical protein